MKEVSNKSSVVSVPHKNDTDSGKNLLDGYLTEEELAQEIGLRPRTLKRWRSQRIGPPWTKIGLVPLYRREGVLKWLRDREVEAVADRSARNSQHRQ